MINNILLYNYFKKIQWAIKTKKKFKKLSSTHKHFIKQNT